MAASWRALRWATGNSRSPDTIAALRFRFISTSRLTPRSSFAELSPALRHARRRDAAPASDRARATRAPLGTLARRDRQRGRLRGPEPLHASLPADDRHDSRSLSSRALVSLRPPPCSL